jgi:XTP/dITP diphosphohydrolase
VTFLGLNLVFIVRKHQSIYPSVLGTIYFDFFTMQSTLFQNKNRVCVFLFNQKRCTFGFQKKHKKMQLVFATNNLNKLKEVQSLIPEHIELLSLKDIGCFEDVPETQLTIDGNAIQKAEYIQEHYGFDCFADDTGLEVEALNGEPGVFSARYAGEQRNANDNTQKLLKNLENTSNRSAQFKTVIALHVNNHIETFTGICKGEITKTEHGQGGFGYDPIFKAEGYDKTFAEITLEEKNTVGHRGKAVRLLVKYLNTL